jgi:tetratricopeptide (TPR) repeat protein
MTSWFGIPLGSIHFYRGDSDKALNLMEQSESLNRKIGDLWNLSTSTCSLGFLYHSLGEWNKGEQYLKESLSISKKTNNAQSISNSYYWFGWSYYDKGEYAKAKELFDELAKINEKRGKADQILYCQWPAMNDIELGEIDKARTLLDDMHKFAHEKQNKQLIADEDARRAMLLRAEKRWNESIELFEKSLQEYEALGARQWNVYFLAKNILYEYARVYLERNQQSDREKARDLLNQALETFQKMGAKKDVEKVEARLLYLETGKEASAPKPIDLVSTGCADLDKLLLGGIPPSYAVVLTSPSCDERGFLVKSFLETGTKKGEIAFYVTVDPSAVKTLAEKLQSNFCLFVCNPQADAMVKSSPNVFKSKGVENLTDISIALTSAMHNLDPSLKGPRRICIDLISDVLLQHHAVQTRRWLTALTAELKSMGFTTLAVVDPRMHPPEELYAILGLFEGEIGIYEKETEKGVGKFLKIKKMSNQEYLENELLLTREHARY